MDRIEVVWLTIFGKTPAEIQQALEDAEKYRVVKKAFDILMKEESEDEKA